ncbi:hypothetical protein BGZ52_006229, partial [Haplosporangium bisporale]
AIIHAYGSTDELELLVKVRVAVVPAQPKKLLTMTEGVVVEDNIYTINTTTRQFSVHTIPTIPTIPHYSPLESDTFHPEKKL